MEAGVKLARSFGHKDTEGANRPRMGHELGMDGLFTSCGVGSRKKGAGLECFSKPAVKGATGVRLGMSACLSGYLRKR